MPDITFQMYQFNFPVLCFSAHLESSLHSLDFLAGMEDAVMIGE